MRFNLRFSSDALMCCVVLNATGLVFVGSRRRCVSLSVSVSVSVSVPVCVCLCLCVCVCVMHAIRHVCFFLLNV